MRRIDTATKAVDLFGPGKHGFKAGNVLAGEAPTKLAADWFNHVQEEIARLVEEFFGVELDGESVNQLATLFIAKFALYATLESPALTGNPTAPTQAAGNNTTRLATTAFVATAIADLIASSPAALDTLNELATALGNDPNFATTITNALALKAPLASPALTGNPTAPTQAPGNNTTRIATTAFVTAAIAVISTATTAQAGLVQLATDAVAKALAADDRAITPSNLAAMRYRSGPIAIVFGTEGTVVHGLGVSPRTYRLVFRCVVANNGWVVGEEFADNSVQDTSTLGTHISKLSATTLKWRVGSAGFRIFNANGAGSTTITPAQWEMYVEAEV